MKGLLTSIIFPFANSLEDYKKNVLKSYVKLDILMEHLKAAEIRTNKHLDITKPTQSYSPFNQQKKNRKITEQIHLTKRLSSIMFSSLLFLNARNIDCNHL